MAAQSFEFRDAEKLDDVREALTVRCSDGLVASADRIGLEDIHQGRPRPGVTTKLVESGEFCGREVAVARSLKGTGIGRRESSAQRCRKAG